ncbi:MAG: methyltransferase domain-containing protein [Archangium sp.]|nr:methyltransferase domain-containing protein [Archangium sp.]
MDIGEQYLSSMFPTDLDYRAKAVRYPLDVVMCVQKGERSTCGLVQLGHHLDLTSMYDAYPYTSSTNSSMGQILKDVAQSGHALGLLADDDVVLDIGGNDGTLLSFFQDEPYRLVSIDPAQNITPVLSSPNYTPVRGFFTKAAYDAASSVKAKLIFSVAMFYHLDDPMTFVRDVATCLHDGGVWVMQMAYLPAMLRTNMYDNIVHEHAGYYAAQHMKWMTDNAGLEIFDVVETDVYGGSFRLFIKKKGARFEQTARCRAMLERELSEGLFDPATYRAFSQRIMTTRTDLVELLATLNREGKQVWVYGASTKGNTILQYCGIGHAELVAAADSNTFKIGKYMIGSDVPIRSEEALRAAKPDYVLALPYSFVEGFMRREAALRASGTKFIVPLPAVAVR